MADKIGENNKKNDLFDALLYASAPYAGKKELEEYESAAPELTMSPKAKQRMLKRLKREKNYIERHAAYHPVYESFKRVAVIVLIVMSLGFTCVVSVEAVRIKLSEVIVEWYEDSIFVKYEVEEAVTLPDVILEYKEPAMDGDFKRYEISKTEYRYSLEYESENTVISYNQNLLAHYAAKVSDNYTEIADISVNGHEGIMTTFTKNGAPQIMLMWDDGVYVYRISGNTSFEELLRLAESIE